MRNFILTVLFAVLCAAGLAASAQDVAAQVGGAVDQIKATAADAVKAVVTSGQALFKVEEK